MKMRVVRSPMAHAEPSRRARLSGNHEARAFVRWFARSAALASRRAVLLALGFVTLALAVSGFFRGFGGETRIGVPLLAAVGGVLVYRLFERTRRGLKDKGGRSALVADFELGTLFIAAAFAVIEITGGPTGLLYPLVFALVAFLVAFNGRLLSVCFLVTILGSEALIQVFQPTPEGWKLFASHASFNLLFGLLYALFLRTEVAQRERRVEHEVDSFLGTIRTEAQEFRLTSGLGLAERQLTPEQLAERRRVGSVSAIRDSLYNVLAVAERALHPHTVALFWLDATDRRLKVKELRSQSDHVSEKPVAAGEGFLGAITKRKEPLVLTNLKPGHIGLVYYERPEPVTDFVGVPVLEGQHLRGVLVADRTNSKPFEDSDVAVLTTIAGEITRTVQVERIFAEMDRDKYQKERFYEASREFNKARSVRDVAQQTIAAARRVAQVELAAVSVSLEKEGRQRLEAVDWQNHSIEARSWLLREFAADEGLVGAAIKARHPLPLGSGRSGTHAVFGADINISLAGIKVLPLIWQDQGVGALVLASSRDDFLPNDVLDMLRVIADHAAIALANAQINERVERMATTDGLTGLINHRTFQEVYDKALGQAERYRRKLSLIIADIDHFKSVNDTYGHPVGDVVLKRIAALLASSARRTDLVARYGGEEFAILMPETDRLGARQIAERIRTAVAAETFHCDQGMFKSSLSLGVATFPEDAPTKAKLTECADQALYVAKHDGRNRTVTFDMIKPRREASQSV
jgi:two-component system, cell cycle response regulator